MWRDVPSDAVDPVAQCKPTLLQPTQQQVILRRRYLDEAIDGGVKIGVLDAQVDQLARKGVKIGVQRSKCGPGQAGSSGRGA